MNGKLIIIEGLDGCGKSTQLELLKNCFKNVRFVSFPNYNSESGKIIKAYLEGNIKENDQSVSAYSASTFYAVDRYLSFASDWSGDYRSGKSIISARYTTSNVIYQMTKLPKNEWDSYIDWLYDFEYNKLAVPKPDKVILLDVPVDISQELLLKRYSGREEKKDIHEVDTGFMSACRQSALYLANRDNWELINCATDGKLRGIEEIHTELSAKISNFIFI